MHRPRITDDSVLTRWMSMEVGKINAGVVRDQKTLAALLMEDQPSATTKNGEPYYFDRDVLSRLGVRLPRELHPLLKLPIRFFLSPGVPDSCSCTDRAAFEALQALGEISRLRTMPDGPWWVSRAIAYAIHQKYPTAVQLVMGI